MATSGNVSGIKRIMRAKKVMGSRDKTHRTAALSPSAPSIRNVSGKTAKEEEP
jgi:hypothetical protein